MYQNKPDLYRVTDHALEENDANRECIVRLTSEEVRNLFSSYGSEISSTYGKSRYTVRALRDTYRSRV